MILYYISYYISANFYSHLSIFSCFKYKKSDSSRIALYFNYLIASDTTIATAITTADTITILSDIAS